VDGHVLAIPESAIANSDSRDARKALDRMMRPSSVAVVGASANTSKPGGRIFSYLIKHGFQGPLYSVNRSGSEILGQRSFNAVADLPETPDLACIVVPAGEVVPVLEDCAERGIPSAIVYTSGFAEAGQQGIDLQADILRVVQSSGIRVSGPNTAGIANAHHSMCAAIGMAFEVEEMPKGNIAFLTQSGALGSSLLSRVWEQGAGFSHWISCGNEVDLSISDYLSFLVDDPDTDVIAIFMEGIRDPTAFADACRRARSAGKPILVYKTGATESGRRAVSSHTAALAGADVLYEAFLKANHVIRVRDLQALVDASVALSWQPIPAGNRVAVISASGGICSVAADECSERGLELPQFSEKTMRLIENVIPSYGRSQNPVDVTAGITTRPTMIPDTVKLVLDEPEIDAILVMLTTNAGPAAAELARGISDAMAGSSKPLIVARVGADSLAPEAVAHYMAQRVPLFPMPERAVEALSVMVAAGGNGHRATGSRPR
jgi:acetate---CoA ligase (ADP-forming)